jgi:hypothetical protein
MSISQATDGFSEVMAQIQLGRLDCPGDSIGARVLRATELVSRSDGEIRELIDKLPSLEYLYELSTRLTTPEEHGTFKACLDIIEYALVRLDGPAYNNYERLFLPVS